MHNKKGTPRLKVKKKDHGADKRKLPAGGRIEIAGNGSPSPRSKRPTDIVYVPVAFPSAGRNLPPPPAREDLEISLRDGARHILRRHDDQLTAVEVASGELSDGSVLDIIRDPRGLEQSAFAVWKDGEIKFTNRINDRGRVLVPLRGNDHILRNVILPSGMAPYTNVTEIARRIRDAIRSCVKAPNPYYSLLAGFSVYSWVADRLPTAVYLLIVGPPESGKTTLLDTLRLFCRRGLSCDDITAAGLAQACSLISPTLMMEESNLDYGTAGRNLQRLLRAGSSRGHPVLRKNFGADVYGAKVICCENLPDDPALVSRCIVIRMNELGPIDLKKPSDPELMQLSHETQCQLLKWRFDHYHSIRPAKILGKEQLHPRERDLLSALAAPYSKDEQWCDLLLQCFQTTGQSRERFLPSDEAAVLDGLYFVTHQESPGLQISVGALSKQIFETYRAAGQALNLKPRAVGAILDKFGIARTRRNAGWMFFVHDKMQERVHEMVKRYGLNLPRESLNPPSPGPCKYCDRIWPPYALPSKDDPDLKD